VKEKVISSYEVIIRQVKKELPCEDSSVGYHRARRYTQYVSADGYILDEHITTNEEKAFFERVQRVNDTPE